VTSGASNWDRHDKKRKRKGRKTSSRTETGNLSSLLLSPLVGRDGVKWEKQKLKGDVGDQLPSARRAMGGVEPQEGLEIKKDGVFYACLRLRNSHKNPKHEAGRKDLYHE